MLRKHRVKHEPPTSMSSPAIEAKNSSSRELAGVPGTPELTNKSTLSAGSSFGAGEGTPRSDGGTLTPAELRQLFERYKATWTGPRDNMTLSDLYTSSDEDERRDQEDIQAKEELFKTKDKNSFSIWSCPVCKAFFTKLWGVRAHITLKHPGASVRPVLHDDKDTSAVSKQEFLKEIKRNAKTAKRELKQEAKRLARIAVYGDEVPRRGRPRKNPLEVKQPRPPIDPNAPRKRGRPRKVDSDAASPSVGSAWPAPDSVSERTPVQPADGVLAATAGAPVAPPVGARPTSPSPAAPPPPPPANSEPPPNCVEKRRWKCITCGDLAGSYDDLVTHTYIAHPDADLPRFEVVVTYVPKPAPSVRTKEAAADDDEAADISASSSNGVETQEDHDAALLDSARVRGAEKRRAPSTTKVPQGVKRRKLPSAAHSASKSYSTGARTGSLSKTASSGGRHHSSEARASLSDGKTSSGGVRKQSFVSAKAQSKDNRVAVNGAKSSLKNSRAKLASVEDDSYKKTYSNVSRRYRDEPEEPAVAAGDATELYCYCRSPYDEVSEMIGCDSDTCKHEWFHFECVGIVIAPKGKWFCPDCIEINKKKAAK